jgi:NADPH:quinone reductase-like Zn-dependent oxidoreductase
MKETMKAIRIHEPGGPDVLKYEDAPLPEPETGEVLIRVHAASVNPADWQMVSRNPPNRRYPWIPGYDVSGVVTELGEGVSAYEAGNEVYGMLYPKPAGAYAEYVVVTTSQIARKPKSLSHIEAAAMPIVGLTAWQALLGAGELSEGQTVLIHAAAGGVGHIAVQMAKWKGAHVIGIASGRNAAFLREIGVDEFIDYTTTRFEDVVRDVDVVLEMFGDDTVERSLKVLRKGGIFVSIKRSHTPEIAAQYGIQSKYILAKSNTSDLEWIAQLIDDGSLRPHVSMVLPLREARKAFELSQKGHTRGKIVLQIAEERR